MNHVKSSYTVLPINYFKTPYWNCLILPAYLDGDSFGYIQKNEPNEQISKQIIYDVLKGLIHLENVNVIHHDIKPENVFLYRKSNKIHAIIGDFGFSEIVNDESTDYEIGGSDPYLAPEILIGAPYSFNSDVWSVGVMMYLFLTHSHPFWGTRDEIIQQIFSKSLRLPLDISSDAQDLLNKLLRIDPSQRLTAREAIQHRWFNNIKD